MDTALPKTTLASEGAVNATDGGVDGETGPIAPPMSAITAAVEYFINEPPLALVDDTISVTVLKPWFVGSSGRPQVTRGVIVTVYGALVVTVGTRPPAGSPPGVPTFTYDS